MTPAVEDLLERADKLQASSADGSGSTRAAEDLLEQALNQARRDNDVDALMAVALRVALIKRDQGDFESALDDLHDLADLARRQGDMLALATALRHMGDIFVFGEEYEMAHTYLAESVMLLEQIQGIDPLTRATHLRSLAVCLDKRGEQEAAEPLWREARDLYLLVGAEAGVAEAQAHLRD